MNRRAFLAAAAGVVAAPFLPLPTVAHAREAYAVTIIPTRALMGRIVITGPTLTGSLHDGAFMRAAIAELEGMTRDITERNIAALVRDGRLACGNDPQPQAR